MSERYADTLYIMLNSLCLRASVHTGFHYASCKNLLSGKCEQILVVKTNQVKTTASIRLHIYRENQEIPSTKEIKFCTRVGRYLSLSSTFQSQTLDLDSYYISIHSVCDAEI